MKKLHEFLKPFLSIILGALLLLFYMNWLTGQDAQLAIGIIAIVMAAYYLTVGILGVVLGDKLGGAKKIFDIISICFFPTFMFVYFLVVAINGAEAIGPTGWVILILSMVASLALVVVFIIASFVKAPVFKRFAILFAATFVLALLLNLLFDLAGNPIVLGNFNIIAFVIYFIYTNMLLSSLSIGKEKKAKEAEE